MQQLIASNLTFTVVIISLKREVSLLQTLIGIYVTPKKW